MILKTLFCFISPSLSSTMQKWNDNFCWFFPSTLSFLSYSSFLFFLMCPKPWRLIGWHRYFGIMQDYVWALESNYDQCATREQLWLSRFYLDFSLFLVHRCCKLADILQFKTLMYQHIARNSLRFSGIWLHFIMSFKEMTQNIVNCLLKYRLLI